MAEDKTEFVEWGEFLPDLGYFRAQLVVGSQDIVPTGGQWRTAPEPVTLPNGTLSSPSNPSQTVALPGGPAADAWKLFVGDDTKLWMYNPASGGSITDVSRTSGGAYTANEWFFTVFGDNVVATDGADDVQVKTHAGSNFVQCFTGSGSANPTGKYLATYRSHLALGHYTEGGTEVPNGVWLGATEDVTIMGTVDTHRALNTSPVIFYDDLGAVTGLASGRDFLLVPRERGWRRIDGPPYQSFVVDTSHGTRWSRSIVPYGDLFYFFGGGSIKVINRDGTVDDVGDGKVAKLLFDPNFYDSDFTVDNASWAGQPDRLSLSGAADPHSNMVTWIWQDGNGNGWMLLYNVRESRFSILQFAQANEIKLNAGGICSLPPRAGAWSSLRNLAWIIKEGLNWKLSTFGSQDIRPAQFRTGYFSHRHPDTGSSMSRYARIRPIYALSPGGSKPDLVTVTTYSTDVPYSLSPVAAANWAEDEDGNFLPPDDHPVADFHRIEVVIGDGLTALTISEFEGVELGIEWGPAR